ncbi:MAG TPA: hypothetical protein VHW23_26285 [Kofleriaceae bacterium]|nr:hypothetical protein [Kofleriaceae bacterium]
MRALHIAFSVALPLAALAAAPVARADTDTADADDARIASHHDEVSFGGAARALRSPSANALTAANLAGVSVGLARDLGHDLGFSPLPGVAVWAEAGFVTGSASGMMFQALSTTIEQIGITAGLAARYRIHRRIIASAHGALGAQRARVAITDNAGGFAYDHGWGATAQASAALDVFITTPPHHFGLGLRVEAGYVAAQGIALTLHNDRDDGAALLAMQQLSIGHLDLSGPTAALSLLGQF